ncbi:hypothetical protein Pan258_04230 [Symmachiella dynata]|uniref:hypothetical protein n=1 Tax=Symmachiella dynata TaxID=2527995 RepID=UPI0011879CFE|nr:hypothetical protein [Symmachiella dynata]QDT46404.1 hypothetical protein Pan258_04230 [Symmachiella dynata]
MTIDSHYELTFDDAFLARWRDDRIEAHVALSKYRIARMRRKMMGTTWILTLGKVTGVCFLIFAIMYALPPMGDARSVALMLILSLIAFAMSTSRLINWLDSLPPAIVRTRVSRQISRQAEELAIKAPYTVRLAFRDNELTIGSEAFDEEYTTRFTPNRMVAIRTDQLYVVFGKLMETARISFVNSEQEQIAIDFLRNNGVEIVAIDDNANNSDEEQNRH